MNYIKRLNNLQASLKKIGKFKASHLIASVVLDDDQFPIEEDKFTSLMKRYGYDPSSGKEERSYVSRAAEDSPHVFLFSKWEEMPEYKDIVDREVIRLSKNQPVKFLFSSFSKKPEYQYLVTDAVALFAELGPGWFVNTEWAEKPEYRQLKDKAVAIWAKEDPAEFLDSKWAEMPEYQNLVQKAKSNS